MFKWLLEKKDHFTKQNKSLAEQIYVQVLQLSKENKYKARIVMDYILKAFRSDEALQDLYEKIYLEKDIKELEDILSFQSPISKKWYKHYKGDTYKTVGVAIPVKEIKGYDDFDVVTHTEDDISFRIYKYNQFLYHDYNDDVFMIYTDSKDEEKFARPYEMFFSLVETHENIIPRFTKIEE
jgi:hypothetical protein